MISGVKLLVALMLVSLLTVPSHAQGPQGKSFGLGFSLGHPTALSLRFWSSRENSWVAAVGSSYLGNPHVHGDYLWHFNDAFNSRIVTMYAGVGVALGFGDKDGWVFLRYKKGKLEERWYYRGDHDLVAAIRAPIGINIIPRNTPLDIFLEITPILGVSPGFGFDIQPALGVRFYP